MAEHSPLRDACEEIADTLTVAGLPTNTNPDRVGPRQAAIFPTGITFDRLGGDEFTLTVDVYALANNRDTQPVVMDTLWSALAIVRRVYEAPEAEAVTFELPAGVQLPGLRIPLTLTVTKE